ncbi:hypothetical protein DIPPA_04510 [Diplonema papillatum]|nr:hypothetical protein DIPPA_04510 [Diplonema papillatum]
MSHSRAKELLWACELGQLRRARRLVFDTELSEDDRRCLGDTLKTLPFPVVDRLGDGCTVVADMLRHLGFVRESLAMEMLRLRKSPSATCGDWKKLGEELLAVDQYANAAACLCRAIEVLAKGFGESREEDSKCLYALKAHALARSPAKKLQARAAKDMAATF